MTLWILFCRMTSDADTLFTFYARDRKHAEQQAEELLSQYPYERIDLKAYPRGFMIVHLLIPGTLNKPLSWQEIEEIAQEDHLITGELDN